MKIVVMGYSGSGKSTLARKLGQHYGCDVLHFDTVQFLPEWEIRGQEEKLQITKEFLDTHDSWVIDGNYSKLYLERRLEEADRIILILFHRFSCLYRVTKRYLKYRNKTRPDMGQGCNEKLDLEFIMWVLWKGRTKETRERYKRIANQYKDKVIVLKNQRELDRWSTKENYPVGQSNLTKN
jgi:adenylate kinase family enzyme